MTQKTHDRILDLATRTVKMITCAVKAGYVRSEYPGEQPTFERIKHSSRMNFGHMLPYRNVFKTKEQYDLFDQVVYVKLRKNSVLKAIRGL